MVMGAACVAAPTLAAETIAQGDNADSERMRAPVSAQQLQRRLVQWDVTIFLALAMDV